MKKNIKTLKKTVIFISIVIAAVFLILFDFKNDITSKIEIITLDDPMLAFRNLNITVSKENELIYEFSLENNTETPLNYVLCFESQHEGSYEFVNMKVINDGIIQYDDKLNKLNSDNIFVVANVPANEVEEYKIVLKGKRIKFRLVGTIKAIARTMDDVPSKVTVTMPKNSETERNFTWHMDNVMEGSVQIVEAKNRNKSIADFENDEVLEFESNVLVDNFLDYVHTAKAKKLKPGTEYYYRVGNKEKNIWSDVGKFVTDDGDKNFSFIYLTDLQNDSGNYSTSLHTVMSAINTNKEAEFLLNTGDFVNTVSNPDEWYGILNSNIFSTITNVSLAGNHDYDVSKRGVNTFNQHFYYDTDDENARNESGVYYSFNYGNVHFVVLNTNDYSWSELSLDQLAWLEKDLKDSQDYDFRIVAMHRGVYTSGPHIYDYGDILPLTYQLTPIFDKYNVDLVLQGHDHTYGLTYPVDGKFKTVKVDTKNIKSKETGMKVPVMVKPSAPVYYINGAAGDKHYETLTKKNGFYEGANGYINISTDYEQLDLVYSKFQKVDTPREEWMNLALFSSIEVKGNELLVNTYTVNNTRFKEPKLYHSFGISK